MDIYYTWAGLTAREYKHLKGLKQENLRDNMTNEELVMNMLAELTTSNITKEEHPETMSECAILSKLTPCNYHLDPLFSRY